MNNNTSMYEGDLESLSERRVALSIPVLSFIGLLVIVGVIGNTLVIFTYIKRVEKSSTNLFIFCLAVFDIINCIFGLPLEIYDLMHPYTNDQHYVCAIHHFIQFSADISSGYIIVCISFDRYLRIARPHQGLSVKFSKFAIGIISGISMIISLLTLFVYGTEKVTFDSYPGLVAHTCGTAEHAKNTVVPLLLDTLVLVCFGVGVIILLIVYTLLGIKVKKWNKGRKSKQTNNRRSEMYFQANTVTISDDTESRDSHTDNLSPTLPETFSFLPPSPGFSADDPVKEDNPTFTKPEYVRELSRSLDRNHFLRLDSMHMNGTKTLPVRKSESFKKRQAAANLGRKSSMPSLTGLKKRMRLSRTTVMFISATIAFVASHLPYACVKIVLTLNHDWVKSMNDISYSCFLFGEYSFIVSYGVNPLIYSFMNPKFRRECKQLLLSVSETVKCQSKKFYV